MSFRLHVLAWTFGLTLGLSLLVSLVVIRAARTTVATQSDALLERTRLRVEARMRQLLRAAELTAESAARLTQAAPPRADGLEALFAQLVPAFEQRPELTQLGALLATTGDYALLERTSAGAILLRRYVPQAEGRRLVVDAPWLGARFGPPETVPDDGRDPWQLPFAATARTRPEPAWTNTYPLPRRHEGDPASGVSFALPQLDAAGALAVLWHADFDHAALSAFLHAVGDETSSRVLLFERTPVGLVTVAHRDASPATPPALAATRDALTAFFLHALAGAKPAHAPPMETFHARVGDEGQSGASSQLGSPLPPWTVGAVVPTSSLTAPVARLERWMVTASLAGAAIAALASWWLASHIARPIEQLRHAVDAMRARGTPAALPPLAAPREIEALAQAFNALATTLAERQATLLATTARLETVIQHLPADFWLTDPAGVCLMLNPAARRRFGDRVGRRIEDFPVPTAQLEQWQQNRARVLAGETLRLEAVEVSPEGPRHFLKLLAPVREGDRVTAVLGMALDLTDRIVAEEALRQSQVRLRSHLENTPLAVIDWSPDFTVLSWNPAAEAIFGWPAREALGRHGLFIVPEHERADVRTVWQQLLTHRGGARHYNQNLTRDGRLIECEWYNTVLADEDGHPTGVSSLVLDITQRIVAEREYHAAEERFRAAFVQSPVPMAITRQHDGRILDVNAHWEELFGHDRATTVGRTPDELGLWADPAASATARGEFNRGGVVHDLAVRVRSRDGRFRTVLYSLARAPHGQGDEPSALASFVDITDREAAETALRASERFLSRLVGNLPGLAYRSDNDADYTVHFASAGTFELTGFTPDELIGNRVQSLGDLIHPEDRPRVWREVQAAVTAPGGGRFSFEYRLRHRTGRYRWVWESGEVEIDESGRTLGLVGFIMDLTARKEAELEMLQLNFELERRVAERTAELATANERLKELDRLKSRFLATMSHELRTPLNSIIGFSNVLRQGLAGPVSGEQRKQLDFVHSSAKHLLTLINDLLDLSRIESGRFELFPETLPVADVLTEVERTLAPLVAQKRIAYTTTVPPAWTAHAITTDRKRLFQVLLNLASNAVKFTEHGGVGITLVSVEPDGGVTLAVRDTGIGIKAEQMGLLFEAFRQLDGSARRVYEGTGLGLHLVKRLLRLLGGDVTVESEFGHGSCFTVHLPGALPARVENTTHTPFV